MDVRYVLHQIFPYINLTVKVLDVLKCGKVSLLQV